MRFIHFVQYFKRLCRGLKIAMFVLQCLDRGQTRQQIVELLNGGEELVDVWISFPMQYDWIEQKRNQMSGRLQSREENGTKKLAQRCLKVEA